MSQRDWLAIIGLFKMSERAGHLGNQGDEFGLSVSVRLVKYGFELAASRVDFDLVGSGIVGEGFPCRNSGCQPYF